MAGPKLRAFRENAIAGVLRLLSVAGRFIPLRAGRSLGRVLGSLAWHVARRERRRALENVAIAFPEWSSSQHRQVIRDMFHHLGMSLFEMMWLPNLDAKRLAETTSFENIEAIAKLVHDGATVVAFAGHVGNWEWLASGAARYGVPVTVLQRERSERGLNELIVAMRMHAGVQTIDRGSSASARELIQAMRKPGAVAFLIDQSIRAESVKVPFFGRPALTPVGPAKLTIRAQAYAVAVFVERMTDGRHLITFKQPFPTKRGDDPATLTALMTREIEEQIRRVPAQWVWMHDRWRDRPKWDINSNSGGRPDDQEDQPS